MPRKRLKSIERILAIQSRIRSLAEWRQKAIERKATETKGEAQALLASLNGDGLVDGLFADMTAKRLHRVSLSLWELQAAAAEQAKRVVAETGREKQTARLADHVRRIKLRADQDDVLVEIIDSIEGKRAASLE
ncbi:hypothetical protein J2Y55_000121 [Bosea sp. BE125]|jgi:hypothetical protein|uniref:hypothetical protein n=1 Tax=Bosea sp. BE125 TaxID=2817909 RepID=UPI00285EE813|nr:hypothetical protein [Bosea sp. BE125]MDR6869128.1 hypothetical protein [Bosea sp. BE125]